MNEWSESVWISVAILIFIALIGFSSNLMYTGKQINAQTREQQDSVERIKEFREYNSYNNKTVYCQDVVSIILETRGEPYIQVSEGANNYYWQASDAIAVSKSIPVQNATAYSSTAILTVLNLNKTYSASLILGDNQEIVGLKFVAN